MKFMLTFKLIPDKTNRNEAIVRSLTKTGAFRSFAGSVGCCFTHIQLGLYINPLGEVSPS
jgi:hypothetical protein